MLTTSATFVEDAVYVCLYVFCVKSNSKSYKWITVNSEIGVVALYPFWGTMANWKIFILMVYILCVYMCNKMWFVV